MVARRSLLRIVDSTNERAKLTAQSKIRLTTHDLAGRNISAMPVNMQGQVHHNNNDQRTCPTNKRRGQRRLLLGFGDSDGIAGKNSSDL